MSNPRALTYCGACRYLEIYEQNKKRPIMQKTEFNEYPVAAITSSEYRQLIADLEIIRLIGDYHAIPVI